jgi:phosphoribosylformimino-5-aminoimidazole carboxamide ribotide isomerase
MEIIPSIDLMQGNVVRLVRGDPNASTIYSHDPIGMARHWAAAGADALHVVDLDATLGRSAPQTNTILHIAQAIRIPVQVGGGIRSLEKADELLSSGVRKVVIGTMAFQNQSALLELLQRFSPERVMVAVDYADSRVVIKGWQEATELEPVDAVQRLLNLGARQFLMTSVAQDGTLGGADTTTLSVAARINGAEVYASGGVAGIGDLKQLERAGVKGVILGKALYEEKLTMEAARAAIK